MKPEIPDLIFQYPTCPLCFQRTNHDGDEFYCEPCRVSWPMNGYGDRAHRWDDEEVGR